MKYSFSLFFIIDKIFYLTSSILLNGRFIVPPKEYGSFSDF